jgi:hypothetical protein
MTAESWVERQDRLRDLVERQLFFVGGAPRSGTTWVQRLLDSHPDICCRGEGLFQQQLADPLGKAMIERRQVLQAKNETLFRHSGGFPLPEPDDTEHLVGTGILLALERLCSEKPCHAVGEKTPENVFLFPRLKRLFPNAKFIGIARDPRDLLSSAWHFFQKPKVSGDETAAKVEFIRLALPSLRQGAEATVALTEQYPSDCMVVTYERMREAPAVIAAQFFRFLGVSDSEQVVADCVARTSFAALSGGRPVGVAQEGSFLRKGVVGDWRSTFTPDMSDMVVRELGWTFPLHGWEP